MTSQLACVTVVAFVLSSGNARAGDAGTPKTPNTKTPNTKTPKGPTEKASGYSCNLLLGVSVTSEWFSAGFETAVDDARWEAITKPHTTLTEWSNAADPVWSLAPTSPCAARAGDPDRVLFVGMQWDYKTAAEWVTGLSAVVNVIKAKYPHARTIELLTMMRAPGNVSCGNPMSVVQPFVDEAVKAVSEKFSGIVRAGPRLEAPSCDAFKKGGPHFTPEGAAAMARIVALYYSAN